MQTIPTPSPALVRPTAAEELADSNWRANVAALRSQQPWVGELEVFAPDGVEWLFARDRSLTAMLPGHRWAAGCSVPRRAARFMFQKMNAGGTVVCFLAPVHAAQIRVVLDLLEPGQAVVALVPERQDLAVFLRCEDFSGDFAAHRLWFVTGSEWPAQVRRLFDAQPGLPMPAQFVRPISADPEASDRFIAPAQTVFAAVNGERQEAIRSLAAAGPAEPQSVQRVCVIAPSRFRLWENPAAVLLDLFQGPAGRERGIRVEAIDVDDPASAGPLALAEVAGCSHAVVAANRFRADAPDVVSVKVPWITWATTPRIPPADPRAPGDRLVLADADWQEQAFRVGWTPSQVRIATWPPAPIPDSGGLAGKYLAVLADTFPISLPDSIRDYSSQVLLWDFVREELARDPFVIGSDVSNYLQSRRARFQVADEGFDGLLFVQQLVLPAYQQGLGKFLLDRGLPVRFAGKGWDLIPAFAGGADGPITTGEQFANVVGPASAVVHVWPVRSAHPINQIGRPVVRAFGRRAESFLRDASLALEGKPIPPADRKKTEKSVGLSDFLPDR